MTDPHLEALASESLDFFEHTAGLALAELAKRAPPSSNVFASSHFSTSTAAVGNLSRNTADNRNDHATIAREPAIARVAVLDEDGRPKTFYITRVAAPAPAPAGLLVASNRTPYGRLAAADVGTECEIIVRGETRVFEIVSRATFRTVEGAEGWDSIPTRLRENGRKREITSLRAVVAPPAIATDPSALIMREIAEDEARAPAPDNVVEGIRREVIEATELRDQPTLDARQDALFRLPIEDRILIVGPPGSGKTTTLIRRLGTKLALEHPEDGEAEAVAASAAGVQGHRQSWIFFTPTDLLKLYLKEAFNKEGIAAPDRIMKTWAEYRFEVARASLGILTTANARAGRLERRLPIIRDETERHQEDWFDDFQGWLADVVWDGCRHRAQRLSGDTDLAVARIGRRLSQELAGSPTDLVSEIVDLDRIVAGAGQLARAIRAEVDGLTTDLFAHLWRRHPTTLDELVLFLPTLGDPGDVDAEEEDVDDDEAPQIEPQRVSKAAALRASQKAARAKALALAGGRSLGRTSHNAKLVDWLGERMPSDADLLPVGTRMQAAVALQWFSNLLPRFVANMPRLYRRFRRERHAQGRWYRPEALVQADLSPLEVDLLILSMIRPANRFLSDRRMADRVGTPRFASLESVRRLWRNQVMVDEVTDFSPIQIACMAALCDPATKSFTAAGDFNQRVTTWGARSHHAIAWAVPGIRAETMNVAYRHSRRLSDFAFAIALLSEIRTTAVMPTDFLAEGLAPALALGLPPAEEAAWLASRIKEVERWTQRFPSVAVLVNEEADVEPVAERLGEALEDTNVQVMACLRGQVLGRQGAVRVFAVEHIKGLEFEAVFFIRIDDLVAKRPDLFDKFLYVGATRAATYLGVTCARPRLPDRLHDLAPLFRRDWDLIGPLP